MKQACTQHFGSIVQTRELQAGDATMAAINALALKALTPDDVAVFSLDICNDQIDKHHSRFPHDELTRINAMIPGRPFMERHDLRGTLPRGTFFRSQLASHDGMLSVRPDVFMLRTEENKDFIANIEGGVYRETSIGIAFMRPECSICGKDIRECRHIPGRDYDGAMCHYVMHDVREVIEGSIVPAGSQGTKIVAAMRAALSQTGDLLDSLDTKEERPYPSEHACRLRQPSDFEADSFRSMSRDHEGKKYRAIFGKLTGEDKTVDQAFRYGIDTWSAVQARQHCADHGGSFEAATGAKPPMNAKAFLSVHSKIVSVLASRHYKGETP